MFRVMFLMVFQSVAHWSICFCAATCFLTKVLGQLMSLLTQLLPRPAVEKGWKQRMTSSFGSRVAGPLKFWRAFNSDFYAAKDFLATCIMKHCFAGLIIQSSAFYFSGLLAWMDSRVQVLACCNQGLTLNFEQLDLEGR